MENQEKGLDVKPVATFGLQNKSLNGGWNIHMDFLETKFEEILGFITEGIHVSVIAKKYNIHPISLFQWIEKSPHKDELKSAFEWQAEDCVEKAESVLLEDIGNNMALANIRRELSKFYQWKASKRAPKVFGNKEDVVVDVQVSHKLSDTSFADILEAAKQKRLAQLEKEKKEEEYTDYEESTGEEAEQI